MEPAKPRTVSYAQRRDGTSSKRDLFGNFNFVSSRLSFSSGDRLPCPVQCRYDPSVPEPEVNSHILQGLPSGGGIKGKSGRSIERHPSGIPTTVSAITSTSPRPPLAATEDRTVVAPLLRPRRFPRHWQEKFQQIQDWIHDTHQATNNCFDEVSHRPSPSSPLASVHHMPLHSRSPMTICIPSEPSTRTDLRHLTVLGLLKLSNPHNSSWTLLPRCPPWQTPICM
ncbi:uncharacterized protein EV420DRAFT_852981 [Desarmillaria tabescens]|uniref:Uncharacterized protein n=1 Tax=Armillaria tabescens TaxID=1929756 RepID=A0AA39MV79_ARMTA|nr:uncharacterized protein EV420DRAFT_852981 [Desarmillaria tabescens]KAK0448306.1 hypothetical protein EV420DRAFT_852981 [Desarmillaria tabescens]